MKRNKVSVRITNIKQAGSATPGRPGNLIVNHTGSEAPKPENWFSSREWRNCLLSNKLNPDLPLFLFRNATIVAERLEITAEDITTGGGKVEVPFPGVDRATGKPRIVTYKQAGVHNINMDLDLSSINLDTLMAVSDLSMKHARRPVTLGAATPTTTETLVDEAVEMPAAAATEAGTEEAPVHEELAGETHE